MYLLNKVYLWNYKQQTSRLAKLAKGLTARDTVSGT